MGTEMNCFRPIRSPEVAILELIFAAEERGDPIDYTELLEKTSGHISSTTVSKSIDVLFDLDVLSAEWRKGKRVFCVGHEAKEVAREVLKETPSAYAYYENIEIDKNYYDEPLNIDRNL
ncbi:MAG: hypothetical protein HXS52_03975 [Theionarchaea archaeon]|nr:hypothetical protein [Theionarchaea archaeon]